MKIMLVECTNSTENKFAVWNGEKHFAKGWNLSGCMQIS